MFSATFSDDIRRLSGTILRDPATVEVAPRNTAAEDVQPARLPGRSRPQGGAARPPHPDARPAPGARLHADEARGDPPGVAPRPRGPRRGRDPLRPLAAGADPALEGFKNGEIRVLVATDVAARGLDIEDLPVVVNFELPWNPQDYIHRIGRTGRAGATGEAISLVCIDEVDLLRGVQRMLKQAIPWTVEDGFVPDRNVEPRPLGDARRPRPGQRRSTMPIASRSVGRAGAGRAADAAGVAPARHAGRPRARPSRLGRRRPPGHQPRARRRRSPRARLLGRRRPSRRPGRRSPSIRSALTRSTP